jgi:hypothetical protein
MPHGNAVDALSEREVLQIGSYWRINIENSVVCRNPRRKNAHAFGNRLNIPADIVAPVILGCLVVDEDVHGVRIEPVLHGDSYKAIYYQLRATHLTILSVARRTRASRTPMHP